MLNSPASLPRQYARTRGFTLGVPRDFTIAPGGDRIVFLRSRGGADPVTCLWSLDVATGSEQLLADPATLDGGADREMAPEERTRRERRREQAGGITAYATDRAVRKAVFALSGQLWVADLDAALTRLLPARPPVTDPRLDPGGLAIAYISGGGLHVMSSDGANDVELAMPEDSQVVYGLPEHVAAESMGRHRGYWWAPDGLQLLVARVDSARVQRWYISDPADPAAPAREIAYPRAGTANADVSLWIYRLDGSRVPVDWDRAAYEYVVTACWDPRELLIVVQSRDQKTVRVLNVNPATGATRLRHETADRLWVEIVPGLPALTEAGTLIWSCDSGGSRRLLVGSEIVTPAGLNLREVFGVDGGTVLFSASREPTETGLWTWSQEAGLVPLTSAPGMHQGQRAGGTTVVVAQSLRHDGPQVTAHRSGRPAVRITSLAQTPAVTPRVSVLRAGPRELRTAVLLPAWHERGAGRLPVLMDPYGGPAGQRVTAARGSYLVSQWFADQGFAVVIADGRGTPGRGPAWEKSIYGDLAGPVLDDQVTALRAAARRYPDLDLDRVAIRGWSFGGFLAALAVLRRPDVFHAAIAGAPVTDHRLYDTHFKERYLGHPAENPGAYDRCCLIRDAPKLQRPLMLIHGLADDNVHAAHTLRLSAALTAAGRPHTVLLLPGVTHLASQEHIAENLLLMQADFVKQALG